jgi:hypothetical protein
MACQRHCTPDIMAVGIRCRISSRAKLVLASVHTLPQNVSCSINTHHRVSSLRQNITALKVHVFSALASWLSNSHIEDLRQETAMPERQVAECRRLWQIRPIEMPSTPGIVFPDTASTTQASNVHAFATPEVSKTFCYGLLRPGQRSTGGNCFHREPPSCYIMYSNALPYRILRPVHHSILYQFKHQRHSLPFSSLINITKTS